MPAQHHKAYQLTPGGIVLRRRLAGAKSQRDHEAKKQRKHVYVHATPLDFLSPHHEPLGGISHFHSQVARADIAAACPSYTLEAPWLLRIAPTSSPVSPLFSGSSRSLP